MNFTPMSTEFSFICFLNFILIGAKNGECSTSSGSIDSFHSIDDTAEQHSTTDIPYSNGMFSL